jgi:methyltransferase (TIGR00027 family)
MKDNSISKTAQYIALFRAIETNQPKEKRLFKDDLAINFLDSYLKNSVKITTLPIVGELLINFIQRKGLGALSSSIARTKYIDDLLKQSIDNGVKQVIILGAGFDTRSIRLDFMQNISVIEIDHPDTSKFKIKKLKTSLKQLPTNTQYLQLDFNKQTLADFAVEQNLNFSIPTTIIWEGVTSYLPQEAIDATFEFVKKFTSNSYIIFTYLHKLVLDNPQSFKGTEKLLKILKESEEKWISGFYPEKLPDYLKAFDLKLIEDNGAEEYRNKYISERKKLLNGFEFHRVAFAKK